MELSVVMPIHNSGQYLKEAIGSLMVQEFKDFEMILVDDASDDKITKQILENIDKNKYSIKVICLDKSVGAGEARNIGFRYVSGRYTIFLDSDDIFAPDFLKKMYQAIVKEDFDISICGYTELDNSYFYLPNKEKIQNREAEEWLLNICIAPWNKLCRTEYLICNNIYFQNLSSCNDVYFGCMVMKCTDKVSIVEEAGLIKYRTHISTQISANRDSRNLFYAVNWLFSQFANDEIFIKQCAAFLLADMLEEINSCKKESQNKKLYENVKDFFQSAKISFTNKIIDKYKENVMRLPYESSWYRNYNSFEWKLNLMRIEILEKLRGYKKIFLWGMGKRGYAFEKFCQRESIFLQGITDRNSKNIGELTEQGNLVVDYKEVIEKADLIIASNMDIYRYLLLKEIKNSILNLEEYCP